MDDLLGYFITFRTYGTWLHGDDRGSTDRRHKRYRHPWAPPDTDRELANQERLAAPPFEMRDTERAVVQAAIEETCRLRKWHIWAVNVRTNHVHVVLVAPSHSPERVMNDLKAYATRALRKADLVPLDRPLWSRHGSTPHLYSADQLAAAIQYVEARQT